MLRSFKALWIEDVTAVDCAKASRVVSALIAYEYAAGALVFLTNLIFIMSYLSEVVSAGLTESFGKQVACTICSMMYPILIAEGLLRPLKHRLSS